MEMRLVAGSANMERVKALTGTEADLDSPEYLRIEEQFAAVRAATPKCRFVYLLGRQTDLGLPRAGGGGRAVGPRCLARSARGRDPLPGGDPGHADAGHGRRHRQTDIGKGPGERAGEVAAESVDGGDMRTMEAL